MTHRKDFLKKYKLEDKGYSLEELSKISGEPLSTLQQVYNRGIGAYKTNPLSVRMKGTFKKGVKAPMSKKLSKEMWAFARVYSYLQKNPKHDNDLRGGADLLAQKEYPLNYPDDAVRVLNAMSFTDGKELKIMGSMALKSQLYAGDYDGYEVVEVDYTTDKAALNYLVKKFKEIIKRLKAIPHTHIGDCKAGLVEEWRVIPKKGFSKLGATKKTQELLDAHIISPEEAKKALSLIQEGSADAEKEIKYHIIRWTPKEILKGKKKLRDGRVYTLQEAFSSPTITKLDVVSLINGIYTEFSVIYEFHNGKKALNPDIIDPEKSLKDDIQFYLSKGERYKALKRKFALAKLKGEPIESYHSIINSDLGKLYVVLSDVRTLADLLDAHPLPKASIKSSISAFKHRLSSIYDAETYLRNEKQLLADLNAVINLPRAKQLPLLRKIEASLSNYLNKETVKKGGTSYERCF
jgi:hypothetical protein